LGFGHIEVGTLTPLAQPGNPQPRLFRLPEYEAIINRMGFNNKGIDYAVERLKQRRYKGVLGINIGKNKITANEDAVEDYLAALRKAYAYADYIAINISSPNTPGLRELQGADELEKLLESLQMEKENLATQTGRRVPLALKIAPDIEANAMDTIAETVLKYKMDGLIVSNTTITRPQVEASQHAKETGGLSGKPLRSLSTKILQEMSDRLQNQITLIGSGGVSSGEDAIEKLRAGASLVQVYSGLIFQGPGLLRKIAKAINQYML
jgi:dihydroorotate dehydrogenase